MNAASLRLKMGCTVSPYQTWRFDRELPHDERAVFAACAYTAGIRSEFVSSSRFERTYVLLDVPHGFEVSELAARYPSVRKNDVAIIALAIEPQQADALPALAQVLGGEGGPAGVTGADVAQGCLLLEFQPTTTPWKTIKVLMDGELLRFGNPARITTLLSPLWPEIEAQIAADGLQCPQLQTDRVIETFVHDADR